MTSIAWPGNNNWPFLQKIAFRFVFIYLILYISPWNWIGFIPVAGIITEPYNKLEEMAVQAANRHIFHHYKALVLPNGSGDTSYNWTQIGLLLILAAAGCMIWSALDRKRTGYTRLAYWVRIIVRYFLIMNCFGYGIVKLFLLQMPFPTLSQLATPLGDYLPMRLSWMFIGYSSTYQFFSGAVEFLAGVLLLFRRTATFGALLAAGIFGNVMVMNLSYDIPVKLFSMHLFLMSLLLLVFEYKRILAFLFLNQATVPGVLYKVSFPEKWMRITRITLKSLFVVAIVIMPFINTYDRYQQVNNPKEIKPVRPGVYDVTVFVLNRDTLPPFVTDTLRWQDVIFEKGGTGSIRTTDTTFRQRYKRGYFSYSADTAKQEIGFTKTNVQGEKFTLFTLKYELPDSNTLHLHGTVGKNTIYTELKRSNRYFQLSERQFHWLSEYNR